MHPEHPGAPRASTVSIIPIKNQKAPLEDRRKVPFYLLDVTSLTFTKKLRKRVGDYPKVYFVMRVGDIGATSVRLEVIPSPHLEIIPSPHLDQSYPRLT